MQQIDRPQEISLKYDSQGLIPALAQDWRDGTVLMVGFMNEEAVTETFRTGQVYFWSRSRQTLWRKGETSGNTLLVKQVFIESASASLPTMRRAVPMTMPEWARTSPANASASRVAA